MRVTPLIAYVCLVGLLGCEGASDSADPVPPPPPTVTAPPTSMPDPPPVAGGGASGDPVMCESQVVPSLAPAALLTRAQYDNTVADLLGDTTRPSSVFPPENQVDGFNNNIAAHQTNPLLVEKYLEAAEKLAAAGVGSALERIAPCSAGSDQRQCGQAFVRSFGQRAFRRPLTPVELQIFDGLFDRSFDASGYAFGVELVLTAMLQSPQFLYRVDTLPAVPTVETGAVALAPYELASRLSYFLLGSMPDPDLFDAAARKQLATDEEIAFQARRLLKLPRAKEMVREF